MTDDAANTNASKKRGRPFQAGQVANPAGRPKGSRNKLGEAFITDLQAAWTEHGEDAIRRVIEERPQDFLKVVGNLLPKEVRIETTSDLTDEQLDARLRAVASALGIEVGVDPASGGAQAPQGSKTAH